MCRRVASEAGFGFAFGIVCAGALGTLWRLILIDAPQHHFPTRD